MMYVRRCTPCDIRYPAEMGFVKCRVCDGPTAHLLGTVDEDWLEKVASLLGPTIHEVDDPIERWRYEELTRAGFEPIAALELAVNRTVDLRKTVTMALNPKCGAELAYRIAS